jgi:enoyl-CoA hydratase/carnithine racemase
MELLLTAAPIDAERAHQIGLVNQVVPAAELREVTQRLATTILANAPLSVRASKRTVTLAMEAIPWDEADRIWEPVYRSTDAQEGPAAFREGRAPRWQGR